VRGRGGQNYFIPSNARLLRMPGSKFTMHEQPSYSLFARECRFAYAPSPACKRVFSRLTASFASRSSSDRRLVQ
jgi:hypothetical protein